MKNKVKNSSKTGQVYKTLKSAFVHFLRAIAKVSFLEKTRH